MHHALDDVFLWGGGVDLSDELIGLVDGAPAQVEDDEVQSGLGDTVDQAWQNLKSLVSVGEDHEVVSNELVALQGYPLV